MPAEPPTCEHFPRCPGTCVNALSYKCGFCGGSGKLTQEDEESEAEIIAAAKLFIALNPAYYQGSVQEHRLIRAGIRMAKHILE